MDGITRPDPAPSIAGRILFHASTRWLNPPYCEQDLIDLVKQIAAVHGKVIITTDTIVTGAWQQLFKIFPVVSESHIAEKKWGQYPVVIADHLGFENWQALISHAALVVTYECGCVHMAALHAKRTIIVYNPNNHPEMIRAEYHPYAAHYWPITGPIHKTNAAVMQALDMLTARHYVKRDMPSCIEENDSV